MQEKPSQVVQARFSLHLDSHELSRQSVYAQRLGAQWVVLSEVDSTNTYLLNQLPGLLKTPAVVSADQQLAGRGRQGKTWASLPGQQVMFSLYWPWTAAYSPAALSLVVAKNLAQYLSDYLPGGEKVLVKWPNDLQINNHKLAGILLETQALQDFTAIVIGVGLNYGALSSELLDAIGQPVVSLADCCSDLPGRDQLLVGMVDAVFSACIAGQNEGFAKALHDWPQVDALLGSAVDVTQANGSLSGVADGVNAQGALRLLQPQGLQLIHSGTVRKR
jgi:BirA family transcriptional regulator, biotin operon repressor / biotin---[acetyl-CoA-carboxylase] ligase